jgi:hypothetical protein
MDRPDFFHICPQAKLLSSRTLSIFHIQHCIFCHATLARNYLYRLYLYEVCR